jgi:flagellar motor switch protein FliN/FliY
MPETMDAPTQNEQPQAPNKPAAGSTTRPQVRPAAFAEAPQDNPAACSNQLDILLDMDVPVAVVLGTTQIPVRRLLQLGPGSVLKLEKPIEAPADLYLKDTKFAEADVVVVDRRFAVRIRQILGAGGPAGPTQA